MDLYTLSSSWSCVTLCPTDPHVKPIHIKIAASHLTSNTPTVVSSCSLYLEGIQVHTSDTKSS